MPLFWIEWSHGKPLSIGTTAVYTKQRLNMLICSKYLPENITNVEDFLINVLRWRHNNYGAWFYVCIHVYKITMVEPLRVA
jgi:hypothetical protein